MNTKKHYPTSDLVKFAYAFGRAYQPIGLNLKGPQDSCQWTGPTYYKGRKIWTQKVTAAPPVNFTHLWTVWDGKQVIVFSNQQIKIDGTRLFCSQNRPSSLLAATFHIGSIGRIFPEVTCAAPIGFI